MNGKILILDYSGFEREKIKYIVKAIGEFEIIEIGDINEYYFAADDLHDLLFIIMDIAFPYENDGFKVLANLRNKPSTRNVPIIIATKSNDVENKKTALHFAVNDYIVKPFSISRLESSINSIIKVDRVKTYKITGSNSITMTFDEYISKEIKTCSRVKQPLSIIFSTPISSLLRDTSIKETDQDLVTKVFSVAADKLKLTLRATDTVILNENNDILILLPSTSAANTKLVNKKSKSLIQEILNTMYLKYDDFFYTVTVTFPDDGMDFQSLMDVVFKKLTDKKLLEKITSIPIDQSAINHARNRYHQFKKPF